MDNNQVAHTLEVLADWAEGFALSFVFSETARCTGLNADVLYCAEHSCTENLVAAALARVEGSTRPVVLNFYGCAETAIVEALRRLNERRSVLERHGRQLVLVCPEALRLPLQYAAPDLWHIRTIVPAAAPENHPG